VHQFQLQTVGIGEKHRIVSGQIVVLFWRIGDLADTSV